ncbi:MAG TPA: outer membrane beta-barrel protein [Cyclobacteriaceae bacterium]|nr:outer membrane beta-barrel protein [Cyclobacteriaceae bacterium]
MKKATLSYIFVFVVFTNVIAQSISNTSNIEKSISTGINISNYVFKSSLDVYEYLTNAEVPRNVNFNIGFNIELSDPQFSRHFSIKSGVSYFKIKNEYIYIELGIPGAKSTYDVKIKNHYLKIPFLINYNLGTGNIIPYFFLGTHANFAFKKLNNMIETRQTYTDTAIFVKSAIPVNYKYRETALDYELMGISFGGGIKYLGEKMPGYYIEIKYDYIRSLIRFTNIDMRSRNLFITCGIIF